MTRDCSSLLAEQVQLHNAGRYKEAETLCVDAYYGSLLDGVEQGVWARNAAANIDRQEPERLAEAATWAQRAFNIHDRWAQIDPTLKRERSTSAMYVGSIALREAINFEIDNEGRRPLAGHQEKTLKYSRIGLEDIRESEKTQGIKRDQYRINMLGRVSMAEALYGQIKEGRKLAREAVMVATYSESPKNPTSDGELNRVGRLAAKSKALVRGMVALAVSTVSTPQNSLRRRTALRLAKRFL